MEETNLLVSLDEENFRIPKNFEKLYQVNSEIVNALKSYCIYKIQSKVSKIVIQAFIDFWVKNKIPSIYKNKIDEYILLNQEFQLSSFNDILQIHPESNKPRKFIPFNTFLNTTDNMKYKFENEIASQLDDYIFFLWG